MKKDQKVIINNNVKYLVSYDSAYNGDHYVWLGNDFDKFEVYVSNTDTVDNMGGSRLKIISAIPLYYEVGMEIIALKDGVTIRGVVSEVKPEMQYEIEQQDGSLRSIDHCHIQSAVNPDTHRSHYELVTGFIGSNPNSFTCNNFDSYAAAEHHWLTEYKNRNKGDGYDEYHNSTPLCIRKVTTIIERYY